MPAQVSLDIETLGLIQGLQQVTNKVLVHGF
jgi:hypothetical protein